MKTRKVHIILKNGKTADVTFNGNYLDCMHLCYMIYGHYPYIDSEYNV